MHNRAGCRRAASRDVVLVGVALGIFALAGAAYWWFNTDPGVASDQFVEMRCDKCRETFKLSYKQMDQIMEKGEFRATETRHFLFNCPKCKDFTARRFESGSVPAGP